ncbi:sodium:calcium antiporter [Candidatus Woesearchaeota archaeon]|nr:sodium:calcium antiporter [Candidatus Woesearchaeota archaeon]
MIIKNLFFFLVACIVLVKSSGYLVKSLVKISSFFRLNEFTVGFIIMAVSTSLPELFVGIVTALNKQPIFALGNAVGSNIIDMTIVIGIVTLLARGIKIKSKIIKKDLIYMLLIVILPVFLMIDHKVWSLIGLFPNIEEGISRIDGIILLLVFIYYLWSLFKQERLFRKTVNKVNHIDILKYIILFCLSIILLIVSANFVVDYASILSIELNIAPLLIGLFIISMGTSLPELMFETKAVLTRHEEMAVGDLIGSVIANSTLVLGVTAIISPIVGNILIFITSTFFMILIAFIFLAFAESDRGLSWKEGMSLILLYLFFVVIETYIKSLQR